MKLRSCERPKARRGRAKRGVAGRVAGAEGKYSTYLTDEQRRDATQMRDFTTGVNPFGALTRACVSAGAWRPASS